MEEKQASGGPRVSIVMATFNPEYALEDTLQSIYSQTWRDYEIVVIVDCDERVVPELEEEIVVVDSGSAEGTRDTAPDYTPGVPVGRAQNPCCPVATSRASCVPGKE